MATSSKKSYAGMFTAKLGKKLPKPKLDMKGLQISKAGAPKILRKKFQSLLIDKILMPDKISVIDILKEFNSISNTVSNSLGSGYLDYATPKKVNPAESYAVPQQQGQVRGMLIWNALEPKDAINPPDRCKLVELNCKSPDDPRLKQLKETHPSKYKAIMDTIFKTSETNPNVLTKYGFTVLSVPLTVEQIPKYLLPFIDVKIMTDKNIQNANKLLESLGIVCGKNAARTVKLRSTLTTL